MTGRKSSQVAVYVRVSTLDQEQGLKSQDKAIRTFLEGHGMGDAVWYRDRLSGESMDRPAFARLQRDIFAGKVRTVVCWKLDRLSRSLRDGVNLLTDWLDKNVRVVAVSQQLDFSGAVGQMVAGILFAVAQMERENLRENTKRGMAAAKARGVQLGKRSKLRTPDIVALLDQGVPVSEVARRLGTSRQAIYDALNREGVEHPKVRRKEAASA